jgi:hypothetical protein
MTGWLGTSDVEGTVVSEAHQLQRAKHNGSGVGLKGTTDKLGQGIVQTQGARPLGKLPHTGEGLEARGS